MEEVTTNERDLVFAEESLVVDAQLFLHNLMEEKGVTRAQLARAMGVSRARVSQIFSDECKNFTIRNFARAAFALGERVEFDCDHFKNSRCRKEYKSMGTKEFSNVVPIWEEMIIPTPGIGCDSDKMHQFVGRYSDEYDYDRVCVS